MTSLFISDLHLDESRPHLTRAFFAFLENQARSADKLYILGDFFEAWIGDDNRTVLSTEVSQQLKSLSDQGTRIFLMHGNRDFLLGKKFCRASGATLINEETIIELCGQKTLLLHGDGLCLEDQAYQDFRKKVRQPWRQFIFFCLPLFFRKKIANELRSKSQAANANKASNIMDVSHSEVVRLMEQKHCTLMIHGHTHRPERHPLIINEQVAERIVLGDWGDNLWYLKADSETDPKAELQLIKRAIV